jgi:hypothetical protein
MFLSEMARTDFHLRDLTVQVVVSEMLLQQNQNFHPNVVVEAEPLNGHLRLEHFRLDAHEVMDVRN